MLSSGRSDWPWMPCRLRQLTQIEQRRHDVDRFDDFVHARAARHAARPSQEERDVRELAVDAVAVPHPPVIVELLAVVAHEYDCGLIVEAVRAGGARRAARFRRRAPESRRRTSPCRRSDRRRGRRPPPSFRQSWPCRAALAGSAIVLRRALRCAMCSSRFAGVGPQRLVRLSGLGGG